MSERITFDTVQKRAANVNRRINERGVMVTAERRNGYVGLDECRHSDGAVIRTITVGTTREIADFLHAMMVGIDLARTPD
jgi:hypothetical protein